MTAPFETRQAICQRHGPYDSERPFSFANIWLGCRSCEAEETAVNELVEARQRSGREEMYARARIDAANIPQRFRDRTLSCYKPVNAEALRARDFAQDYAESFGRDTAATRNLLLLGTPGTGKTHLACGIALHLAEEGRAKPLYTTVQQAVRRVKATWDRGASESEGQAIAAFVLPDLLVLDEVGVQFGSDAEKIIIFDIMNGRYELGKATIVVSNLIIDDIAGYLGARVIDRLREDGAEVFMFTWGSMRNA